MEWYDYFQSYAGYFWQWEEEGEVLAIPNGSTVAYREFVSELLQHLAAQGLPPFGSLLLSMIATNPDGDTSLDTVYALMNIKLGDANGTREPLKPAISFLKLLSQLPAKYKAGKNRLLLMQTLFANCHNIISATKSKNILDAFRSNIQQREKLLLVKTSQFGPYHNDFRVITLLAAKFPDVKTIMAKLADLPFIEEEIALEKEDTEQVIKKGFVEQLTEHNQTFHVGSLIRRLWSSLQIPYHHVLPSRQPMGGISDLTNKGEFDKLLISEFAHDDFILLSRLANNEALYVNREVPPQNNQLERIILIDVSIKNWGTPKTIAHALLLAIARHPKTDIRCSAFAVGDSYHQLAFDTIDDVISSLQVLEPSLHPAKGLEAFFRKYGAEKNKEIFFISAKEVYAQPQLRKIISEHQAVLNYLIYTDHDGNIDVYKKQQNSKRHVQHIQLSLEEHWKREPKLSPASSYELEGTKPVYPILFPGTSKPKKILSDAHGRLYLITADRALVGSVNHQSVHAKGWEMLYENLPYASGEAGIGIKKNGEFLLLMFDIPNRKLIICNVTTNYYHSIHFHEWKASAVNQFIFRNDLFYHLHPDNPGKCWTFNLEDQIVMRSMENTPHRILDTYVFLKNDIKELKYKDWDRSVLKNVTEVFINEVNNLVINIHELRLTDHSIIKLEKSGFLRKKLVATSYKKDEFHFPDGSMVTINRSGMMMLKSSAPSIGIIYVPLVLDADLAVASEADIAGNQYYYPEGTAAKSPVSRSQFWKQTMQPFIDNIIEHGTEDKTTS